MGYNIDIFNEKAVEYDNWYMRHVELAKSEAETIKLLGLSGLGIDVGAGSGFFTRLVNAVALDPSIPMLKLAKGKTWAVVAGVGEMIPVRDSSMDYVLIVVTLCFAKDPKAIMREGARVLKRGGRLVACIVPLESPWGRLYSELGRLGHVYYSRARFLRTSEVVKMGMDSGLRLDTIVATLSRGVGEYFEEPRIVSLEEVGGFGFVCVSFIKV